MRDGTRLCNGRQRNCCLLILTLTLMLFTYIEQVVSLPIEPVDQWPTYPRRNIGSLARDGYKRSISILAKNGDLPSYRSTNGRSDKADKQERDEDEAYEKRNIASLSRLRTYSTMKRNIQALARDGRPHRPTTSPNGSGQSSQQNDKRNIGSLSMNESTLTQKKNDITGDEYYYPFYQNPIPPLSEVGGPYDFNEMYDLQQSVNPDMFPPLSQVFKRSTGDDAQYLNQMDWYLKRGSVGMPVHGLYRPAFVDPFSRSSTYILSMPDEFDHNNVNYHEADDNTNEDKRSVGSIPLTRISELGNISLVPKLGQLAIQTTPTYRRRQYLLTRSRPGASSTDR